MKRALVIAWCLVAFPLGLYAGLPGAPRQSTPSAAGRVVASAEGPCRAAEWDAWRMGLLDWMMALKDPERMENVMNLWLNAPPGRLPDFKDQRFTITGNVLVAGEWPSERTGWRQDSWGVWRPIDELPELPKGVTEGAVVKVRGVNYYRTDGRWIRDDGLAAHYDSGRVEYLRR